MMIATSKAKQNAKVGLIESTSRRDEFGMESFVPHGAYRLTKMS